MGGVCRALGVVINAVEAYYLASAPSAVTVCVKSLCTMVGFYSTFRAGVGVGGVRVVCDWVLGQGCSLGLVCG